MLEKFVVLNVKKTISGLLIISILTVLYVLGSCVTEKIIETASQNRLLPVYCVQTDERYVSLTFDCAWGADDIQAIIETLNSNDVKATFFTVGTWVDNYPEEVKLLADNDMEVGNHSNSHAHVNQMSYGEVLADMTKCNEKIEAITGKKVKYYRGPYGEYNNTVISVAKEIGMQVIQWDIDTLDYNGLTSDEICARIKSKLKNGSIILMHNDTKYTASSFQKIIDTINDEGFEIIPLSELVYDENYMIDHTGRQKVVK